MRARQSANHGLRLRMVRSIVPVHVQQSSCSLRISRVGSGRKGSRSARILHTVCRTSPRVRRVQRAPPAVKRRDRTLAWSTGSLDLLEWTGPHHSRLGDLDGMDPSSSCAPHTNAPLPHRPKEPSKRGQVYIVRAQCDPGILAPPCYHPDQLGRIVACEPANQRTSKPADQQTDSPTNQSRSA